MFDKTIYNNRITEISNKVSNEPEFSWDNREPTGENCNALTGMYRELLVFEKEAEFQQLSQSEKEKHEQVKLTILRYRYFFQIILAESNYQLDGYSEQIDRELADNDFKKEDLLKEIKKRKTQLFYSEFRQAGKGVDDPRLSQAKLSDFLESGHVGGFADGSRIGPKLVRRLFDYG